MFRKAVCGVMLFLLLIGVFYLAVNIKPVKSEWTGTVYIRADGSIDPPDAPIITYDNTTYTLTDNITSSGDGIVVERDNIIINGTGYTIQGTGSGRGIDLSGRTNVTVRNTQIKNFFYGIYLYSSFNNSISENKITANNASGVGLFSSNYNIVSGNNITAISGDGIVLVDYSNYNIISGNSITNSGSGIYLYSSCNYNIISGNNITANERYGVELFSSSYNVISGNSITATTIFYGVALYEYSNYNIVSGNNITANYASGVGVWYSYGNIISGNDITNNHNGIYLYSSFDNIVSGNNITANNYYGVVLIAYSSYNSISGNNIANNYWGVGLGVSSDNRFYHNNLIRNTRQVYDWSWDYPYFSPSVNVWDDGYPSGGNYWSDYTGVDVKKGPIQNLPGSDGIGDTPYVIDASNRDRYPLMNPWGSGTPIASFTWTPSVPEVGEVVAFDASASMPIGGEIVSYEWDFGDGSHATGRIATHAYGSAGTFTVTLNVTDSEGLWDIEQKQIEVKAPPPLTVSISPTSASILVGESVTFTSTTTGGYPPYTYQWYLNGTAVSGATSSSWTFTPTTSGYYIVRLNVTDSASNTADSNEATVTVAPPITVSISPLSASILVGQSVTFTSTVTGGYTPYSYQWYLNGNPVSGATSPSWTFTPTTSGIYYINLKITDGKGNTAQSDTARIIVATVPVGGYSTPINANTRAEPAIPYIMLMAILTVIFTIKRKTIKNRR